MIRHESEALHFPFSDTIRKFVRTGAPVESNEVVKGTVLTRSNTRVIVFSYPIVPSILIASGHREFTRGGRTDLGMYAWLSYMPCMEVTVSSKKVNVTVLVQEAEVQK